MFLSSLVCTVFSHPAVQVEEAIVTIVAAGEDVVPASELAEALKQVWEIPRLCCQRTGNGRRMRRVQAKRPLICLLNMSVEKVFWTRSYQNWKNGGATLAVLDTQQARLLDL